jgi:hypothetical protein
MNGGIGRRQVRAGFWRDWAVAAAVSQQPGAVAAFQPEVWHYTGGRWQPGHIRGADAGDFIDQFAAVPGTKSTWAVGLFKSGRLDLPAILSTGRSRAEVPVGPARAKSPRGPITDRPFQEPSRCSGSCHSSD